MVKIKRTVARRWLGNGMGYDPAEYAIIVNGEPIGRIQYRAGYWFVDDLANLGRDKKYCHSYKEAREHALTAFV